MATSVGAVDGFSVGGVGCWEAGVGGRAVVTAAVGHGSLSREGCFGHTGTGHLGVAVPAGPVLGSPPGGHVPTLQEGRGLGRVKWGLFTGEASPSPSALWSPLPQGTRLLQDPSARVYGFPVTFG